MAMLHCALGDVKETHLRKLQCRQRAMPDVLEHDLGERLAGAAVLEHPVDSCKRQKREHDRHRRHLRASQTSKKKDQKIWRKKKKL
jgi:hypothetical protein